MICQVASGRIFALCNKYTDMVHQAKKGMRITLERFTQALNPPQLMKDIIGFFTKKNEWVLDYFMGVGGTLLGASLCNRRALGIDLNREFINSYKAACKALGLKEQETLYGEFIKAVRVR